MKKCADSVSLEARSPNQVKGGGSIPASALYFHIGERDSAEQLIKAYHYSRRMPSNIQLIGTFHMAGGLFGTKGDCVVVCVFSIPPTRWSETVYELSRLVRHSNIRLPLTKLVSMTVNAVRKHTDADLLVSFADQTHGHHGGIYQACGWNYGGQRGRRMDGLVIDGDFVPGRTCNSLWGTQSPRKLRLQRPNLVIEPHYDYGKHLYWKAIKDTGRAKAERLNLKCLDYPKPANDISRAAS